MAYIENSICENSLKNIFPVGGTEPVAFSFQLRHQDYRDIALSTIERFEVKVDGEEIDPIAISFWLNNKRFQVWELKDMYKEYWYILDRATIEIDRFGGLSAGEHEIEVLYKHRVAYIPQPFNIVEGDPHTYAGKIEMFKRTLVLQEENV